MKLRVEGDGSRSGTHILTEDGRNISKSVAAVNFRHEIGQVPTIEIDIRMPSVGFPGEGKVYFGGRQVSRIVYADGGEEEL